MDLPDIDNTLDLPDLQCDLELPELIDTDLNHIPSSYTPVAGSSTLFHHPTKGLVENQPIETPAPISITALPSSSKANRKHIVKRKVFFCQLTTEALLTALPLASSRKQQDDTLHNQLSQPFPIHNGDFLAVFDPETISWFTCKAFRTSSSSDSVPFSYNDIANSTDKIKWYKTTDAEMAQLQSLGTFKLVPLPPGRTGLRNKWVFKVKRDPDGQLIKYKSRLTACGYAQKHGIDYSETYSPVARAKSLRFFLTIRAALGRHPHKMDVTGAFLYGFPDKEIYMEQAPGYVNKKHPDHVLLLRNLYGLKQAPRLWHQTILPHLQSMGFASIDADP